ncbi:MAG: ABC transporter ATP-binding protein [Beijerinckiaceae bacterium]
MLSVDGVTKRFGGLTAVDSMSLSIPAGGVTGLIGPNGAGKTTLFNCIAGSLAPDEGAITFNGARIDGLRPDAIFALGLARTFQIPRPFPAMTVLENVMTAPLGQSGEGLLANWLAPRRVADEERRNAETALRWIDFVGLTHLADQPARVLSGGQRKLLELARVMAADPKLVLLDEPGAGVNPALMEIILGKIEELNRQGVTFLLIEHNMEVIARLCGHVVVMAEGRLLTEGKPADVVRDARVIDAYLGIAA